MSNQWWFYKGSMTTGVCGVHALIHKDEYLVVDDPLENARSIKPRTRFTAPMSSVQHLLRIKKVAPIKMPVQARRALKAMEASAAAPAPEATKSVTAPAPVPEPIPEPTPEPPKVIPEDAGGEEPVVASAATALVEDSDKESAQEQPEEAGEGEPKASSEPSEEEAKPRRKRRRSS